ncbi:MAG: DEAD/DEAH box helicase [Bacteroidia bacterium]
MKTFLELGIDASLAERVAKMGYETPTPIQQKAIPVLMEGGNDLIGLAQTGTGKTAAFGLPLISQTDEKSRHVNALILAPTRELCLQITSDLEEYTQGYKALKIVAVYGGASLSDQVRKIKQGAQIIVATPGRLIDLIERKAINLQTVKIAVLDEADEMLNMGFKEDMDEILSFTPADKNVWLFSATMPRGVREIAKNYMNSPKEVTIGEKNAVNENIEHRYIMVSERERYPVLERLLDYHPDVFGLIFCRTKLNTQDVADKLIKHGYSADALHGDLSQGQRDQVMSKFRARAIKILVATDVAARGIDVDDITHVFHMHLPDEKEYYTHRSGRTARAGKKGISIALVNHREKGKIRDLERAVGLKFRQMMVPTGVEICQQQLMSFVHRIKEVKVNEQEIDSFLPEVMHEFRDLSREEIISRFASLEFNRFFDHYRNAADLNEKGDSGIGESYSGTRFFINLGKMDGLEKPELAKLISEVSGIPSRNIDRIYMKGAYSFFVVEEEHASKLEGAFHNVNYKGRDVRVEITGADDGGSGRSVGRSRSGGSGGRSGGSRSGGSRSGGFAGGGGRSGGSRSGGYGGSSYSGGGGRAGGRDSGGERGKRERNSAGSGSEKRSSSGGEKKSSGGFRKKKY